MSEQASEPFWIHPSLRSLAEPLASLSHDPRNARKHGKRNIAAIVASLKEHGQRKPIVVQAKPDGSRVVRAGNGTLEAARRLGWTHLAVVLVEESDADAGKYAIRDNRTGELAEWDDAALHALLDEYSDTLGFDDLGFDADDFAALAASLQPEEPDDDPNVRTIASGAPKSRTIKLYFTDAQHAQFDTMIRALAEKHGKSNITDTVFAVLADASKTA